jgi:hypothetical protein
VRRRAIASQHDGIGEVEDDHEITARRRGPDWLPEPLPALYSAVLD